MIIIALNNANIFNINAYIRLTEKYEKIKENNPFRNACEAKIK